MCEFHDADNVFLLLMAVHRESSLDFLHGTIIPSLQSSTNDLSAKVQKSVFESWRLLGMPTTHTKWRLQGIRSQNILHQAAALIGQLQNVRSQLVIWLAKQLQNSNLHVNKHQSFLQADFNNLSIKVFYKVILSLLTDMIKHSHSTQSNKLAIALKYLKMKLVIKLFNKNLVKKVFYMQNKIFQCRNCFCVLL